MPDDIVITSSVGEKNCCEFALVNRICTQGNYSRRLNTDCILNSSVHTTNFFMYGL